jgi:hypothetical protein
MRPQRKYTTIAMIGRKRPVMVQGEGDCKYKYDDEGSTVVVQRLTVHIDRAALLIGRGDDDRWWSTVCLVQCS